MNDYWTEVIVILCKFLLLTLVSIKILLTDPTTARTSLSIMVKYQKLTNSHRSDFDNGLPLNAIRKLSVLSYNLGGNITRQIAKSLALL